MTLQAHSLAYNLGRQKYKGTGMQNCTSAVLK